MIKSLDRFLTIQALEPITNITHILTNMGLVRFHHDITYPNGEISMLSNKPKIFEHYYKTRPTAMCVDDSGRCLAPGIYLSDTLIKNYHDCRRTLGSLHTFYETNHSFFIVEHEDNCQHFYAFYFKLAVLDFNEWLINHIHLFKNFIELYKVQANKIIMTAHSKENRFILPTNNYHDDTRLQKFNLTSHHISLTHKDNLIVITLSKQLSYCFFLLMQGFAAKKIAKGMGLSPRTVSHYIGKLLRDLGCKSTKELITSYVRQFHSLEGFVPHEKL